MTGGTTPLSAGTRPGAYGITAELGAGVIPGTVGIGVSGLRCITAGLGTLRRTPIAPNEAQVR